MRFGEHDPLVLVLKKEVIDLQLRQIQPVVLRAMLFERNVKELEFVQTVWFSDSMYFWIKFGIFEVLVELFAQFKVLRGNKGFDFGDAQVGQVNLIWRFDLYFAP